MQEKDLPCDSDNLITHDLINTLCNRFKFFQVPVGSRELRHSCLHQMDFSVLHGQTELVESGSDYRSRSARRANSLSSSSDMKV